jgi:hypothetical protein
VTTTLIAFFGGAFTSSSVWAQTPQTPRANGPFANLFGANSSAGHALDFHGYLFEAYQEVLLPADVLANAEADPAFQRSQSFGGATGTLNYHYDRRGDHSFINVSGLGSVADYSIEPDRPLYTALASASGGLHGQITQKVQASVSGGTSYSPFYSYAPFSSTATADQSFLQPEFGFASVRRTNIPVYATAQITDRLSRRSTLTARLQADRMFVFDDVSTGSLGWTGDLRFTRQLSRRLSVYGGYRYSQYQYSGSEDVLRSHGADAGFNFGDSLTLQLGRRTYASFFGGLTGAGDTNGSRGGTSARYAVTGTADIRHTMGRTWTATAVYNRHLGFNALFAQPVLSDQLAGIVSGQLAPRVNWNLTAAWMQGRVGFTGEGNQISSSYASSTATFALGRIFGLYAQYLYYRYELPAGTLNTFGLPGHAARQIASVGLTLAVPIFRHNTRTPRDTR